MVMDKMLLGPPLHCKKGYRFPVPSRDDTYQTLPGQETFNYFRPGKGNATKCIDAHNVNVSGPVCYLT